MYLGICLHLSWGDASAWGGWGEGAFCSLCSLFLKCSYLFLNVLLCPCILFKFELERSTKILWLYFDLTLPLSLDT